MLAGQDMGANIRAVQISTISSEEGSMGKRRDLFGRDYGNFTNSEGSA